MFECDEDLGLDEDFTFTQETEDSNLVGPSENCLNQFKKNPELAQPNQNIFLKTNKEQINSAFPQSDNYAEIEIPSLNKNNLGKRISRVNTQSFSGGSNNCSVFNSEKDQNNLGTNERDVVRSLRNVNVGIDLGKASSSKTDVEFKKPACVKSRGSSGCSNLEENQQSEQNSFWEDGDVSDAFSEDITFDIQQSKVFKKPTADRKATPSKRKFPGPAGILPESSGPSKSFYDNGDVESVQSIDIPLTDYPCTQDNSQFSGQLWMRMCSDFSGGRIFLPDSYNIAWIKKQASAKVMHNHKAPFLAAVIIHLEQFTSKTPNVIVTLKDASGQMNASLHSDLYEAHKQDLTVGSVIVLRDFSVLTINTSGNMYLTITKRNLLTVYSQASSRNETQQTQQLEYTQAVRSIPKVTKIQNYNLLSVIEDTLNHNYYNSNQDDSIRKSINSIEFHQDNRSANCDKNLLSNNFSQNNSNLNLNGFRKNLNYENHARNSNNKSNPERDLDLLRLNQDYDLLREFESDFGNDSLFNESIIGGNNKHFQDHSSNNQHKHNKKFTCNSSNHQLVENEFFGRDFIESLKNTKAGPNLSNLSADKSRPRNVEIPQNQIISKSAGSTEFFDPVNIRPENNLDSFQSRPRHIDILQNQIISKPTGNTEFLAPVDINAENNFKRVIGNTALIPSQFGNTASIPSQLGNSEQLSNTALIPSQLGNSEQLSNTALIPSQLGNSAKTGDFENARNQDKPSEFRLNQKSFDSSTNQNAIEDSLCKNPFGSFSVESRLNKKPLNLLSKQNQIGNTSNKNPSGDASNPNIFVSNLNKNSNQFENNLNKNSSNRNQLKNNSALNKNPFEDDDFDEDGDIIFTEGDKITSVLNNPCLPVTNSIRNVEKVTFSKTTPATSSSNQFQNNPQDNNYETKRDINCGYKRKNRKDIRNQIENNHEIEKDHNCGYESKNRTDIKNQNENDHVMERDNNCGYKSKNRNQIDNNNFENERTEIYNFENKRIKNSNFEDETIKNSNFKNEKSGTSCNRFNSENRDSEVSVAKLNPVSFENKFHNGDDFGSISVSKKPNRFDLFRFKKRISDEQDKENEEILRDNKDKEILRDYQGKESGSEKIAANESEIKYARHVVNEENVGILSDARYKKCKEFARCANDEDFLSPVKRRRDEFISSSQISVGSEDQEHSQILEETFAGVDADSFFEDF